MKRILLPLVLALAAGASPALAAVNVTPSQVGDGPYYLDRAGETYQLTGNVTVPGTAFVFAADNVTLDLGGHTVTFGQSPGDYRYGVVVPPAYPHANPVWAGSDITVWRRANHATVRNGAVIQGAARADSCAAVSAYDRTGVTVQNLEVTIYGDDTFAMRLEECTDVYIFGNTVVDNTTVISNRHQGRAAIDLLWTHDGAIEVFNNTIENCRQWGIRVGRRAPISTYGHIHDNVIHPNTVVTNGYAIGIHGDNLEAYGNTIRAARGRGIHIDECAGARVHDNVIDVLEEPVWDEYDRVSAHGIKLELCRTADVYNNTVTSRGRAVDPNAVSNGAALSVEVQPASDNYVHGNTFTALEEGGPTFEAWKYYYYAVPVEMVSAFDPSGLRIEDNVFRTNDRFFTTFEWHGPGAPTDSVDASGVSLARNTFEWADELPRTGREEIMLYGSAVYGLTFTDCTAGPGVDLSRYYQGWPWGYCTYSCNWTGTVLVQDPSGTPLPGVTVHAAGSLGAEIATAVSGADGRAAFSLPSFQVESHGYETNEVRITRNPNPYTFRATVGGHALEAHKAVTASGYQVVLVSDGSQVVPPAGPEVNDFDFGCRVDATTPAPGDVGVSPHSPVRFELLEPVLETSLTSASVRVTGSLSGPVAGTISVTEAGHRVVFTPSAPFRPGETVTARLDPGVTAVSGHTLDGNDDGTGEGTSADAYSFSFTVAGSPAP